MFGPVPDGETWTGDDAAVVRTGPMTLVTTDSMSEYVDFDLSWASGADVGYKLVAINVSDIAAMGGRSTRAVATVQVGDETPDALIEEIARGMAEAADRWDVKIVGGDIGRSAELVVSMSLLGDVVGAPVLRSGARPGELVCVSGSLGGSGAGLLALQMGEISVDLVRAEINQPTGANGLAVLAARQLRPHPRAAEGRSLGNHATAMIDISDGFAIDLERLCLASGVGCTIEGSALPIDLEVALASERIENFPGPLELALTGGEDFELLFTLPPDRLEEVHRRFDEIGTSVSVVGTVTDGDRMIDGEPLKTWSERSWDHLRTR